MHKTSWVKLEMWMENKVLESFIKNNLTPCTKSREFSQFAIAFQHNLNLICNKKMTQGKYLNLKSESKQAGVQLHFSQPFVTLLLPRNQIQGHHPEPCQHGTGGCTWIPDGKSPALSHPKSKGSPAWFHLSKSAVATSYINIYINR